MENYEEVGLVTREEERCITKMDIMNTLRKLSRREQQVMTLRYFQDMTQQQVAELLGISQVQISRIEKKSLKTMGEIMGK
jgi:RNA polymerase sporulation-specific sigma factor